MYAPRRLCPIVIRTGRKPPFGEGETAEFQLAIWVAVGLGKLGRLRPADQRYLTIPTLATHGYELHLLALQERGDENLMDGRLRLGSTETPLELFEMLGVWISYSG